jgi:nicotinamidase-related amidase
VRVWDQYLTERDQVVCDQSGFGKPSGFGENLALLIIDVQYNFCGEKPEDILESIKKYRNSCGNEAWESIGHIETLMHLCRNKNRPIFYTESGRRHDMSDSGTGGRKNFRADEKTSIAGTRDTTTVEPLTPRPQDFMINKTKASAFFGTPFMSLLTMLKVDTLIVTGGTASGCVRATTVDAASYNLNVVIPEECVFDRFQCSRAVSLFDMNCKYADVIPTEDVAAHIRAL